MKLKFVASAPDGYMVWDGDEGTGKCLGKVWKNERRYNLRRLLVVKGWSARKTGGPSIGVEQRHGEATIFRTRQEAAEALVG